MKTNQQPFRIARREDSWYIEDPFNPKGPGVPIDSATVDATRTGTDFVEGYIVATHGVSLEVVDLLNRAQLRDIGIAAQLRSQNHNRRHRVHLMADGTISRQTL